MKRIQFLLAAVLTTCLTAQAQLNGDGYYRVQNIYSERYIHVIDNKGKVNVATADADLGAIETLKPFEKIVSEPGSVIYFAKSGEGWDLKSQATSTKEIINYDVRIAYSSKGYQAYASDGAVSKYLCDEPTTEDDGVLLTTSMSTRFWYIKPITPDGDEYFGVKPDVKSGSDRYLTFYASFPFSFVPSGMKAYTVDEVTDGIAVLKEITGVVPTSTPVLIKCVGDNAADNKFDLKASSPAAIANNLLVGVYFCNSSKTHLNRVAYKPATMRMLGTLSDGSVGFVKSDIDYIPSNRAYLQVTSKTPDEVRIMTREEYDAYQASKVTITARNFKRAYGSDNPTFTYTTTGAELQGGQPELVCEATATSPVGTYPIVVKKGGVTNENVVLVNGTLTVTAAPLTISGGTYTKKQLDPMPTLKAAYKGFVNGEDESVLTAKPVLSCVATAESAPGTYPVTVSGAEAANYSISYESGVLTVTEADLITVTVNSCSRAYGSSNPTFEYTVSGGQLQGKPELVCQATATSPVGTYPIEVKAGTISYPNLKLVAGTLTVTAAPLTISAGTYTKKQLDPLPTFKASYKGFVNGENESVLTTKPVISCEATAESAPGTYPVTVSGAEAANYTISYENGVLTVTEADLITVTVNSCSRAYGSSNPTFEYTVSGGQLQGKPELVCQATATSSVGTYPIEVKAGTISYPNLKLVAGTLTVTAAPLTISAGTYTKQQLDPLPNFTLTYAGFKNGEDESVLTTKPVVSCEATAESAPGEYAVTVSGAEAPNYAISYVAGRLIVTEADAVTIIINDCSREYGDANPQFTYLIEGEADGGETFEGIDFECQATATSPVGTYAITLKEGTATYPNLKVVSGILTVTAAPLTISVGEYRKEQYEAMPTFTLTYTGFKNGEDESELTVLPVVSCEADEDTAPGEYPIVVGGAEAENYAISYVNGRLIVTVSSGIAEVTASHPADVYTLTGMRVRTQATTLAGLLPGVYVVNGKKVRVK